MKSNCQSLQMQLTTQSVYIYFVSSRRPKLFKNTTADPNFMENFAKEREQICADVAHLEEMDRTLYLTDGFLGASIAYVARRIEEKIEDSFHCEHCKWIFEENDKVVDCFRSSTTNRTPCRSTYDICAATDKYIRIHKWNDTSDFKIKYFIIFQQLDLVNHEEHKFHLIKSIVNEYCRIRGNQLSKKITNEEMREILRKRLNKIVLRHGQ